MGGKILSIAAYVPKKILTNKDLEKIVDTSDEWILTRTGIKERHIAEDNEFTSTLATEAAKKALERAELSPKELDMIVVASATHDYWFPATACIVQANIGAENAACFDIEAACPGFVYALEVGRGFLSLPNYNNVLVIGAETLTKITDYTDRGTCILFGDGAGAAVLTKSEEEHFLGSYLKGNGKLGELLIMPACGTRKRCSKEVIENREHFLKMQGREVFKHAVVGMQEAAIRAVENAGITPGEIDWLVAHQANKRIIDATRERLGLPEEKVYINIDRYGNTSSASIPIALNEMYEKGLLKRGQILVLDAFGAGFIYGAIVIKW